MAFLFHLCNSEISYTSNIVQCGLSERPATVHHLEPLFIYFVALSKLLNLSVGEPLAKMGIKII